MDHKLCSTPSRWNNPRKKQILYKRSGKLSNSIYLFNWPRYLTPLHYYACLPSIMASLSNRISPPRIRQDRSASKMQIHYVFLWVTNKHPCVNLPPTTAKVSDITHLHPSALILLGTLNSGRRDRPGTRIGSHRQLIGEQMHRLLLQWDIWVIFGAEGKEREREVIQWVEEQIPWRRWGVVVEKSRSVQSSTEGKIMRGD